MAAALLGPPAGDRSPPPDPPHTGRQPATAVWSGLFRSPALSLAVRAIAERTRDDSATVLMTAYAIALAQVRKVNPVVFRPVVSNRFRPGLAEVVCRWHRASLYVLTIERLSLRRDIAASPARRDERLQERLRRRTDLDEAIAVVRSERGADLDGDLNSFYNDRRSPPAMSRPPCRHRSTSATPCRTPPSVDSRAGRSVRAPVRAHRRRTRHHTDHHRIRHPIPVTA